MNPSDIAAVKRLLAAWQTAGFVLDTDTFSAGVTPRSGVVGLEFRRPGGAVFRIGIYPTLAILNGNLAPEANVCALVATPGASADIGLYAKTGATGAGSWVKQADFTVGDPMLTQLRGFLVSGSQTYTNYLKAQVLMAGGGTVTWGGANGKLAWTGRLLSIPVPFAVSTNGYIGIDMPGAAIPASRVYDGVARDFDATGVMLKNWEALWVAHDPGGIYLASRFYITELTRDYVPQVNWLLVAVVNGDDGSLKLGTGAIIHSGGSYSPGAGSFRTLTTSAAATFGGNVLHGTDNAFSFGTAARRASVVYAATGSINTSDAREKTLVDPLSDAQVAAAGALAREIGTFRYLDAVVAKGDRARLHVGMTVQRAIEILEAHGLDPFALGIVCHDAWDAVEPTPAIEGHAAELDADGAELAPAIPSRPATPGAPAGDRYGFRTDELLLFLARGFDARLAALEADRA